ncbi:hypothetical protein HY933_03770 [Candidatus Falkowbacteria bacterium]|nr:hypothetical protein [Candidatus Falkowbacteria bacterium]
MALDRFRIVGVVLILGMAITAVLAGIAGKLADEHQAAQEDSADDDSEDNTVDDSGDDDTTCAEALEQLPENCFGVSTENFCASPNVDCILECAQKMDAADRGCGYLAQCLNHNCSMTVTVVDE